MRFGIDSLQSRVALIVFASAVPAFLVLVALGADVAQRLKGDAQEQMLDLADHVALDQGRLIDSTRDLLTGMASMSQIRFGRPAQCSAHLRQMKLALDRYNVFIVTNAQGDAICSSQALSEATNFADRDYFRELLQTSEFAVGDYVTGRLTGVPVLPMAYPIPNTRGDIIRVVITSVSLAVLNDQLTDIVVPDDMRVTLLDRDGKIFAQRSNLGQSEAGRVLGSDMTERVIAHGRGVFEATGTDGQTYYLAAVPLAPNGQFSVVVDQPKDRVLGALIRTIVLFGTLLAALALVMGAVVWLFGHRLIVRPIRALIEAARQLAAGDLSARSEVTDAAGEVRELSHAFDTMANAIASRESDLRAHAAELEHTNKELTEHKTALLQAQKMEVVGQLTGGIAHDFNNILTVVVMNLQLLERNLGDTVRVRKHAASAIDGAMRGAELTKRLLAFSRRQVLQPEVVNINKLFTQIDHKLLQRALGDNVDLASHLDPGLWSAEIDRSQLETALLNLAVNARDAMPDGGQVTIEASNTHLDRHYADMHAEVTPGDYVMIAVSDTGTGMPQEVAERVFEPFFTTKPEGKGTGLGLSMVYGFVKQSGGHIKVYSEQGRGTTIKLYLPRADAEATQVETARGETAAALGGDESILVVEDKGEIRDLAVTLLEELGYRVRAVSDGPSAVAALRQQPHLDLLFTDILMPGGMTGLDVAKEARKLCPEIKVLFTSGFTENALIQHELHAEITDWLAKPYQAEELARTVRRLLDQETERSMEYADA